MKLSPSLESLEHIQTVAKQLNISQEEIINQLNKLDDRIQGKLPIPWILKQIKHKNIRFPEDSHRLIKTLNNFQQVKPRLHQKDINQYRTLHNLEIAIEPYLGTGSKRSKSLQIRPETLPGVELLNTKGNYKLYKITNPDSLAELGTGTKWCTKRDYPGDLAEDYISRYGWIGLITRNNKLFIQFTPDFGQTMDTNDEETILRPYRKLLKPLEPTIMKDPQWVWYAENVIEGRWPEAEPTIMKDPYRACWYAENVIEGRWPEAEPTIMKDPEWAYVYARDIMGDRWPEAEPTIMENPNWAYYYARDIIEGRWPEAESIIMKNPKWAHWYARYIIKDRWPEAEPTIIENPEQAYNYARSIIGGRWPEAEPTIIKNPGLAYWYARYIIKGRWPEAESIIMKSPQWARRYKNFPKQL